MTGVGNGKFLLEGTRVELSAEGAEALASALVGTVIGNLNKASLRGIGLLCDVEDDIQRLENEFSIIQGVLQDAEVKQRKNDSLRKWLLKVKDVAYDAENVLDLIATAVLRRRFNSERGKHGHLTSIFSKKNPLLFRLKIALKVKDIRGRLHALAELKNGFVLTEGVMNFNRVGVVESRQTASLVTESEIFGRNEEREIIIQKLIHDMADRDDLSVCAVWGMGGIGKTTLAQLVFKDERVKEHFELQIWVCVSEDFSLQRLVRAILESVQGGGSSVTELDPLLRELQEKLRGKKFLLVLDDVWNEEQSLWDRLKESLGCGSKGSGVMVTTRSEKIALMMATTEIMSHRIGYLSDADSWSLFKRGAFAFGTEEEHLVRIGEAIVKKCGGVPLAIKALGSLMQSKSRESEWLAVKESETWNLPARENAIFPVLMLSYDNLSPQMRQCFAYCCIFPKDEWMDRDELIQLWMANGFLHEEGQEDLYLIGQSIFKELVWRSFLQDVEKQHNGLMRCKMHDLLHDLAESVMRQETYRLADDNVQKIPPRVRHLSLLAIEEKMGKVKLRVDTLHSFITPEYSLFSEFGDFVFSILSNQQDLRVLDSTHLREMKFWNFVHKWEHLRFLSMSCRDLTMLPESITRLHNLQTLKLIDSHDLLSLPEGLKYMKNLWFVELESHRSLICTPPGLGELTSLQRLSIFIVGEDSAHQISQLKELNLGWELSIRGLEHVRNLEDAKAANMIMKRDLATLFLSWTDDIDTISMEHFEETLEGIEPHHNLEKIHISSYQGLSFPNWMSAVAFSNLSKITLESCEKCEHLPPLGKLPALKVLKLVRLYSIRRLGSEWCGDGNSSFVALTKLHLLKMRNLEEWRIISNSHESFLHLQWLVVKRCPKLNKLPFLPALKKLKIDIMNPEILESTVATSIESVELSGDADERILLPGGLMSAQKNLSDLRFDTCSSLRSFPATILENVPSLRSLTFDYCAKLEDPLSGPLQRVVGNLHELEVHSCPELKCLPESIQQLRGLRKLSIVDCRGLSCIPEWIGNLESLSKLDLSRCSGLKSLPDGFVNLHSLSSLTLWDCSGLVSLPNGFGNLQSLSSLSIGGCSGLKSLPVGFGNLHSLSSLSLYECSGLTVLPDGFGNLKSLSVLDIRWCSLILRKRCEKSKGEDWPKISHIPRIYT